MRRTRIAQFLCVSVLAMAVCLPAMADVMPPKYRMEPVARNLANPAAIAHSPDGRIFYLERLTGNVRIIQQGTLLVDPFVNVAVANGPEEGLLGIALHPNFLSNGWVYLYYTQATPKTNRIVRYTDVGSKGASPVVILDNIGSGASGEDNGGSLIFGKDGKLYATIGVFGNDGDAQLMTTLAGKLLRMNDDGTVPADNPFLAQPSPFNLIYSMGFRNPGDVTLNAGVDTRYVVDNYDTDGACDEVNVLASGGNFGWSLDSCAGTGGGHVAPLQSIIPQVTAWAATAYTGGRFPGFANNLFVAGLGNGRILRDVLSGAGYDTLVSSSNFYVPTGSNCPTAFRDLATAKDGWMYAVSDDGSGGNKGIYRVIYDDYGKDRTSGAWLAGPREVGATPYFPLSLGKEAGGGLKLYWEDLKKDAWGCSTGHCPTGSETFKYTVWSGPLQSPFAYTHTAQTELDGVKENDSLLSHAIAAMPSESRYYLISARGDNLEGSLGKKSDSTERPGYTVTNICDNIGYGNREADLNKCTQAWAHDYPNQDNQPVNISDFRGKAVHVTFHQYG